MIDESTLRALLAVQLVIGLPAEAYFRLRSRVPGERLNRTPEGWLMLATLRPLLVARLGAILAFIVNPRWMAWSALSVPPWLRGVGICLGVSATGLLLWVLCSLGRNLTDTVVCRSQAVLIQHGPYRWVRHPLYLSFGIAAVADTLMTANWFVAATGAAVLFLLVLRTRVEERCLVERFGEAYRAYCRSTGRFLHRRIRAPEGRP